VLEQVGRRPRAVAPEQVGETGGQLVPVDRLEAQIVEQVLAELQLAELVDGDDHQYRRQRHLAGPEVAAEGEGGLRVGPAGDDGTRPAVLGLVGVDGLGRVDAPQGSRRGPARRSPPGTATGEAQQWLHGVAPPLSLVGRCGPDGSGSGTAGGSEQRQVAVELELGDVGLVAGPLLALVADEPLEHVVAEGVGEQIRALHEGEGVLQAAGQVEDALGVELRGVRAKRLASDSGGSS